MQNILNGKLFSSRSGTIGLGIAAAVLAGILLLVYLNRYRSSVNETAEATPVLVSKSLIPKNTPGNQIAQRDLFQVQQIPKDTLKPEAIVDPAYLNGRQAVTDIFPGQQLTTADFTAGVSTALSTQVSGRQRGVALPVDGPTALAGLLSDGDRVDVYVVMDNGDTGIVGLLERDLYVLHAPGVTSEGPAAMVTAVGSGLGSRLERVAAVDQALRAASIAASYAGAEADTAWWDVAPSDLDAATRLVHQTLITGTTAAR